eukprot:GHVU01014223.1.p1 GENE.GHVU01014223.1~~GHVU01014223.1.p1  ORF type:complete len:377 (+),score=39.49 GHVU01014223.1:50-1180(+)
MNQHEGGIDTELLQLRRPNALEVDGASSPGDPLSEGDDSEGGPERSSFNPALDAPRSAESSLFSPALETKGAKNDIVGVGPPAPAPAPSAYVEEEEEEGKGQQKKIPNTARARVSILSPDLANPLGEEEEDFEDEEFLTGDCCHWCLYGICYCFMSTFSCCTKKESPQRSPSRVGAHFGRHLTRATLPRLQSIRTRQFSIANLSMADVSWHAWRSAKRCKGTLVRHMSILTFEYWAFMWLFLLAATLTTYVAVEGATKAFPGIVVVIFFGVSAGIWLGLLLLRLILLQLVQRCNLRVEFSAVTSIIFESRLVFLVWAAIQLGFWNIDAWRKPFGDLPDSLTQGVSIILVLFVVFTARVTTPPTRGADVVAAVEGYR